MRRWVLWDTRTYLFEINNTSLSHMVNLQCNLFLNQKLGEPQEHAILVCIINDDAMIGFLSMLSRFFECSTKIPGLLCLQDFFLWYFRSNKVFLSHQKKLALSPHPPSEINLGKP